MTFSVSMLRMTGTSGSQQNCNIYTSR